MSVGSYVMITPARNEETTIETTIQSVLAQTHRPKEWVIVSDRSTDQTDQILSRYAGLHSFIHPVRVPGQGGRSFASAVRAIEAGVNALQSHDYNFLSLSDADVRFQADYFERLIGEFNRDPLLGLAGGLVCDVGDENPRLSQQNLAEVAGAAQFFLRKCFESLGGLVAIPEGGWDAVTCVRARMNGFKTRTFPELPVDHLRARNAAYGHPLRRKWQLGLRDYVLGSHPLFEAAKCCARWLEPPRLMGSAVRLLAYGWAALTRRQRCLPDEVVRFIRCEQLRRLNPLRLL